LPNIVSIVLISIQSREFAGQTMNTEMQREISLDEIDSYHRDGVVLIKDMFDSDWIDVLKRGLITNCANPTHRARTWDRDAEGSFLHRGIKTNLIGQ